MDSVVRIFMIPQLITLNEEIVSIGNSKPEEVVSSIKEKMAQRKEV